MPEQSLSMNCARYGIQDFSTSFQSWAYFLHYASCMMNSRNSKRKPRHRAIGALALSLGLAIQLANRAGLQPRLDAVEQLADTPRTPAERIALLPEMYKNLQPG